MNVRLVPACVRTTTDTAFHIYSLISKFTVSSANKQILNVKSANVDLDLEDSRYSVTNPPKSGKIKVSRFCIRKKAEKRYKALMSVHPIQSVFPDRPIPFIFRIKQTNGVEAKSITKGRGRDILRLSLLYRTLLEGEHCCPSRDKPDLLSGYLTECPSCRTRTSPVGRNINGCRNVAGPSSG